MMKSNYKYHMPVMLDESIKGLNINPDGVYVDVTFGGGGHSAAILEQLGDNGSLLAFDQDEDAAKNAFDDERFTFISANFRFIKRFLRLHGVKRVDGILGDFGVSSHQFDVPDRGFTTRFEAKLDMRMNQGQKLDAYTVINNYPEEKLKDIFYQYGELKNAPKLARTIVEKRRQTPIETSKELNELLWSLLFKGKQNKVLARIYQAIRIEVNQEIEALKEFLRQTEELLNPGGRLSLISYHSIEDRLVKRYIRSGLFKGQPEKDFYGNVSVPFKKVRKMRVASDKEIETNKRARSAKLRIGERLGK